MPPKVSGTASSSSSVNDSNLQIPPLKLLMLGDSGVGKSSIICQFAENTFNGNLISTVGVDFKVRKLLHKGKHLVLRIWDTAGQEQFKTITRTYYRGAMGVVLVYDVTDIRTFQHIAYWIRNIQQYASPSVARILVANKVDLTAERQVTTEMGELLAKQIGIPYYECSAKDSVKVDAAFHGLADCILESLKQEQLSAAESSGVNLDQKNESKGKCC